MATTTVIGSPASFAIEYAIGRSPRYIHARLWIEESWVGDMNDTLMPEAMCWSLVTLGCPNDYPRFTVQPGEKYPTFEYLFDHGNSSFGESFDPFCLDYFNVIAERRIHFLWKLSESYYRHFPSYSREEQHHCVSWQEYQPVVVEFVNEMIKEGMYFVRPDFPSPVEMCLIP